MKYIEKYKPDVIFTFDKQGISGHINHIAIRNSVEILKANHKELVKDIEF